ncbi:dihydroxyacetone kinase subunit DhaL [Pelagovum pacificum]|uniref:Dihydroxyacetone kinase subunit DhaK n=1 Tax=Pelagovum pacificum TaxID=2588711 RepID=A0A5C5GCR6_9RHOB|nr:dihydroxyacetone kinase subunit DhaL [Pelagovum pacificum]QQA41418.1 dihydroxyacetone kinase subunit DhaK [Pelagovum pacificum]TNY31779.1 dihydroxyacetone kinase subunit DhaK [Pelagovum pacificum]
MAEKTKKLINDPDDVISELVDGMAGAHPDLLRVDGPTGRALAAVDGPRDGKVGIVVGGGSGHEPLFSGYVGRGLADASAIGNVFASPSPTQICDAARAADGGAGVLFLYGNYTGDVMNFDMAAELLVGDGIEARSVQVRDDVASAPRDRRSERRGIAGDIFVFKAAGAAADLGHDLDRVEALAKKADAATASMGVALGPCSLPQTREPNFEIGPTEMEIGMGIHGEPGIERIELETADAVADRLLDPILADLGIESGARVAIMVNGLGSTAMLELYILHRRVRQRLAEKGIEIHRSWVGNYATSLEMAGASVTLMTLDDELTELLDHPCHTLALQVGKPDDAPSGTHTRHQHRAAQADEAQSIEGLDASGPLTPDLFRAAMLKVADRISAEKDQLSRLDGAIGDGDHGVTMDVGWRAVREALESSEDKTISAMCRRIAASFLDAVGASAGPLYASGFLAAGKAVDDRLNLDAGASALWVRGMRDGIVTRGGAEPGDKTMVDAWAPAADAASGESVAEVFARAAAAADEGAKATEPMVARFGRAAKLGDRSIGHPDPGAVSTAMILEELAKDFSNLG